MSNMKVQAYHAVEKQKFSYIADDKETDSICKITAIHFWHPIHTCTSRKRLVHRLLIVLFMCKTPETSRHPVIQNRLNNLQPLTGILCSSEQQCNFFLLLVRREPDFFAQQKTKEQEHILCATFGARKGKVLSYLFLFVWFCV